MRHTDTVKPPANRLLTDLLLLRWDAARCSYHTLLFRFSSCLSVSGSAYGSLIAAGGVAAGE
jgi:hypothetical protein